MPQDPSPGSSNFQRQAHQSEFNAHIFEWAEENLLKEAKGAFVMLEIGICRSDGSILIDKLSESASFETLDKPLFDPKCLPCKAQRRHFTYVGRKLASRFQGHTLLCMALDSDWIPMARQFISLEMDVLDEELKLKSELFEKIGHIVEGKCEHHSFTTFRS